MENNKTYRLRTTVNGESGNDNHLNLNINQDFDILEILSLKIKKGNMYKLHTSKYGCIVGRVIANGNVGVPNAKISVFINVSEEDNEDIVISSLYPYARVLDSDRNGVRYNLLPEDKLNNCHQNVGTFPSKRMMLDDNNEIEIFEKYYKYTTRTNGSGDYMIFGVPTGNQDLHVDIDLSDIGFLSQKPRDMIYKGYDINQFENANMFKSDTNIDNLVQIIAKNETVYVNPFWGEEGEGDTISITRKDIPIDYKFEPTCVFMGSIISDDKTNAFNKSCIPTERMGKMNKLTTGSGTIEMIRKKPDNTVEEFHVQGNQVINGDGVWCYQIPMNLDYMATDEYGNLVPTDDPERGIPTRARVRFRVSLNDFESDYINNHLSKVLVPNNPKTINDVDYIFGTYTKDKEDGTGSFRDLFWNNVYTVKSYIPRIQKGNSNKNKRFSGIKAVNVPDGNNPIPYNNIRINLSFMFSLQCAILKMMIRFITFINRLKSASSSKTCVSVGEGVCPDLENWYFAPGCSGGSLKTTLNIIQSEDAQDPQSIAQQNDEDPNNQNACITNKIDYLMQCIEINLAMEYEVIQFDFYNDWINGLLYIPRWFADIKKKRSYFFGLFKTKGGKVMACMEDTFKGANNKRFITQQCALTYKANAENGLYNVVTSPKGCGSDKYSRQRCHRGSGRKRVRIMNGKNGGGLVHTEKTLQNQKVYYFRPCEWVNDDNRKDYSLRALLFATDIVLLGSLNDCDKNGIPQAFKHLTSSTFQMPTNLAATNMDSEGYMYGKNRNGTFCSGTKLYKNVSIEQLPQTFESYQSWSRNSDDYIDDLLYKQVEYPITETAGIDWGYVGPNQDESSYANLYYPGGHFLGMACNAWKTQTNIKSCINLSRVCEAGVGLSQRQVLPYLEKVGDTKYSVKYNYLAPTGLISKDEIFDSDFRSMFATLNYNGLKTKKDINTNYLTYDIEYLMPTNFDGGLKDYVDNKSYKPERGSLDNPEDGTNSTYLFKRALEKGSDDYYRFRLGIKEKGEAKKHYLWSKGANVALPVYENSFYFYFGLKNGVTAFDEFITKYFAECPKLEDAPVFNIETSEANNCDGTNGLITVEVKNVEAPIKIELENDKDILIHTITGAEKCEFTGLTGDIEYNLYISGGNIQRTQRTVFIAKGYPEEVKEIDGVVNVIDFDPDSDLVVNLDDTQYSLYTRDGNPVDGITGKGVVNIDSSVVSEGSPICGYVIYDENYFIESHGTDTDVENYITLLMGSERHKISGDKYKVNNSVQLWYGNNDYTLEVIYKCSDDNFYHYNTGMFNVGMKGTLDFYIGDYNATYKKTIEPIINKEFEGITYNKTNWFKYPNFIEVEKWALRKALYFTNSLYTPQSHGEILITPFNGSAPYEISVTGNCESYVDNVLYVSETLNDKLYDYENEGWTCDINNFAYPTENEVFHGVDGYSIDDYKELFITDYLVSQRNNRDGSIKRIKDKQNYKVKIEDNSSKTIQIDVPSIYMPWHFRLVIVGEYNGNEDKVYFNTYKYHIWGGVPYNNSNGRNRSIMESHDSDNFPSIKINGNNLNDNEGLTRIVSGKITSAISGSINQGNRLAIECFEGYPKNYAGELTINSLEEYVPIHMPTKNEYYGSNNILVLENKEDISYITSKKLDVFEKFKSEDADGFKGIKDDDYFKTKHDETYLFSDIMTPDFSGITSDGTYTLAIMTSIEDFDNVFVYKHEDIEGAENVDNAKDLRKALRKANGKDFNSVEIYIKYSGEDLLAIKGRYNGTINNSDN